MIEHPPGFKTAAPSQQVTIPVYLTKDEIKKQRRRRRMEREKVYLQSISEALGKTRKDQIRFDSSPTTKS